MNQPSKAPRGSAAKSKRKEKPYGARSGSARAQTPEKRRGLASGSRTRVESGSQKNKSAAAAKDPRIGSKVPVALVVDETKVKAKPQPKPKAEAKPRLSPEEELAKLENDERLNALLDRIDDGETLNAEDQAYVDKTLDRIDVLMDVLGIELGEDDDEEEEKQEDILKLLKGGNPKDAFNALCG